MSDNFIFYVESNAFCLIIFCIMLAHDLLNVDRQEKQIKYDHALIAFIFYFVSDSFWVAVATGIIVKNIYTVIISNLLNYFAMTIITYMWLRFVMAVEHTPHRNRRLNKFAIIFPFIISTLVLIITYVVSPSTLITDTLDIKPVFNIYLIAVPDIYIVATLIYTIRKAKDEINPIEKRKHIYIGVFPLMVVCGGLIQVTVLPTIPVYCFCCAILMIIFYIKAMDSQISVDPLTGLNNRGKLIHYISQEANIRREGKLTFVTMIDINDFKLVNDTFGHSEGDKALVIVADALKTVINNYNIPSFLGRYGGDEFILITQLDSEEDIVDIINQVRENVRLACNVSELPYELSIGVGYDELTGQKDTIQKCMQRADHKLYVDKEKSKIQGITTVCR